MPNVFMPDPIAGLYYIGCKATNTCYIGQSRDMTFRWLNAINQLVAGVHSNPTMQRDFNQYGIGSFRFVPYAVGSEYADAEHRRDDEKQLIDRAVASGASLHNRNLGRDDGRDW